MLLNHLIFLFSLIIWMATCILYIRTLRRASIFFFLFSLFISLSLSFSLSPSTRCALCIEEFDTEIDKRNKHHYRTCILMCWYGCVYVCLHYIVTSNEMRKQIFYNFFFLWMCDFWPHIGFFHYFTFIHICILLFWRWWVFGYYFLVFITSVYCWEICSHCDCRFFHRNRLKFI